MKKILSFLLAATMLCAMFVLPSSAADNVNYNAEFKFIEKAPVADGVVNAMEYGDVLPFNTFSKARTQFVFNKGHTKYTKWDFDFYSAWDAKNLYLAWVVKSDIHGKVPMAQLGEQGEVVGPDYEANKEDTIQKMWMYSCVQLVITPGNPTSKDYQTNNDWLEVGFCEMEDGTTGRAAWCYPQGVNKEDISLESWTAVVKRDDAAKTTTYEIAIPWAMTGVYEAGTNKQFGLAYAVATQKQYFSDKPAMIEWQDVILTGGSQKKANNCAVVTLKGGNVYVDTGRKHDGVRPANIADKNHLVIDGVNKRIVGNDSVILTKPKTLIDNGLLGSDKEEGYNLNWTYAILLKPTGNAGEYQLVDAYDCAMGGGVPPVFAETVTDDMLIAAFHTNDINVASDATARIKAAKELGRGTILKTWEINLGGNEPDTKYLNSSLYVEKAVGYVDPAADIFGTATVDGKAEKDGDVVLYEAAEDAERVLTVADANLKNTYILVFDKEGKLAQIGEKINADVTVPAGGKALTFFFDDNNQKNLALKVLYDGALETYVTEEVADNGLRTIDAEKGCPYTLTYDVVDGTAEFFIPKTAIEDIPDVDTGNESEAETSTNESTAASSEASDASEGEKEEGGNLGLIIGIIVGVLVLAGAGAAAFFIIKKKKA